MTSSLLGAGAVGAAGFVLCFLLDGATRPAYSVRRHPVSALALGGRGWLQTGSFMVAGTLVAAGGVGTALTAPGPGQGLGAVTIIAIGLALAASGVFAMDPMRGYPPGTPEGDPARFSRRHEYHDHAGAVVFGGLPLAALLHALMLPEDGWRLWSGLAGIASAVLAARFARAWEQDDPHTGLVQRAFLVLALGWLTSLFVHLMR